MSRAAFRELLDIQIRVNKKTFNSEKKIEVQHDNIMKLIMKNAEETVLYVYIFNLDSLWQIKKLSYEVISEHNHNHDLKYTEMTIKKIKMTISSAMSEYNLCENIIKIFVTFQSTSFDLLELSNLDELDKTNVEDRTNHSNNHESDDWVTLNFSISSSSSNLFCSETLHLKSSSTINLFCLLLCSCFTVALTETFFSSQSSMLIYFQYVQIAVDEILNAF